MAIMIPSYPYGYSPESREDDIFFGLEKLPNDYFVFHSFKFNSMKGSTWKEKEIDFLIYHREKGILAVEAKAGEVWCDHGIWRYASGIEMKNPFKQAEEGRWRIVDKLNDIQKFDRDKITDKCKILFAVWFPSITRNGLKNIVLPQYADPNIILTADDLNDPQETIDRILATEVEVKHNKIQTNLSDKDNDFLLNDVLCPEFKIIPPKSYELDYKRKRFDAMIAEQSNILNYLEYQRNAVINGVAGTGKTMIAVEKARRHSEKGEPVLFLCFNSKLKEHLEKAYPYENVSYYTIDGFACKMCSTPTPDFDYLESVLLDYDDNKNEFPYRHVIIDEGQDFGQDRMHADSIFALLEDIVLKTETGSFYVFYDKLQMIQSDHVPKFIEDADCKLTLYKNCRNTKRIAETSFRPLKLDKLPKLFDSALTGESPMIAFCPSDKMQDVLDEVIKKSVVQGMENIQIVSCSPSGQSAVKNRVVNELYTQKNRKVPFTTVRKFKGLEADHVILIDVDKELLMKDSMLFYVGSSRAKFQLTVIVDMDSDDCTETIKYFGSSVKKHNPEESLAKLLGCKLLD